MKNTIIIGAILAIAALGLKGEITAAIGKINDKTPKQKTTVEWTIPDDTDGRDGQAGAACTCEDCQCCEACPCKAFKAADTDEKEKMKAIVEEKATDPADTAKSSSEPWHPADDPTLHEETEDNSARQSSNNYSNRRKRRGRSSFA